MTVSTLRLAVLLCIALSLLLAEVRGLPTDGLRRLSKGAGPGQDLEGAHSWGYGYGGWGGYGYGGFGGYGYGGYGFGYPFYGYYGW